MMKEYDVVILKKDLFKENLKKGMRGAIVMIYDEPDLPRAYEVEFINDDGDTIAVLTVKEDDIELVE